VVFRVHHGAIGIGVGEQRAGIDEQPRLTNALRRQVGDHDLLSRRIGEIDAVALRIDGRPIGDRNPAWSGGADFAAVEHVEPARGCAFAIVH
jgi:hypothetical protein